MLSLFACTSLAAWTSAASARTYDAAQPWLVEGIIGTVQAGPDGSNLGSGQNYGGLFGYQMGPSTDIGLVVGWANARNTGDAVECDVTSGGIRARAWLGTGRWSPYGSAGARLYYFDINERSVLDPVSETFLKLGGEVGAGVLYSRSNWWGGIGVEVHAAIGETSLGSGNLLTYATYNLFVGTSIGQ